MTLKRLLFSPTLIIAFCLFQPQSICAQEKEELKEESKIKTGWTFGAVPAIAYDSDTGFKYGGVVNFYNYGDGSRYPRYDHSIYLEWSRTTKGSGINQFTYDTEQLIPGIRMFVEASLLTDKALDFYGFNGYRSKFDRAYTETEGVDYLSRLYYNQDRKLLRIKSEFIGKLSGNKLKWFAGFAHNTIKLDTVDITSLNEGKTADLLPPVNGGLFGNYIHWGLLPEKEVEGGTVNLLKLGLIYDTRDNEPNPMTGMWTEAQLILAPNFLGNRDHGFSKYVLTHRQYFTILPKTLNFAYRLSYQGKLSGTIPFYMLPFVFNSPPTLTRDGLGGNKTLRGLERNRVVGDDMFYSNAEFRWKFYRRVHFNQNIYLALSTFMDAGMVTREYKLQSTTSQEALAYLNKGKKESLHVGYGAGLHIVLNENFILAFDYGIAVSPEDGSNGLYIGLNFLF